MSESRWLRAIPTVSTSLFGAVLGISGLGNVWRAAHRLWEMPAIIGEAIHGLGAATWLVLVALYAAKWLRAPQEVHQDLQHPVQCCFFGLIGISTMLVAGGVRPHASALAYVLFACGALWTLVFALWRTGRLWQGGRDPASTTAILYLPAVAGSFVAVSVGSELGYADWPQLVFGAGLFSWLAIESVLLHRLYTAVELTPALRPSLGIQLAPPTVGCAAYLSVTHGPPDLIAHALLGYGILQALLLIRLLPWIRQQAFAATYWSFTFGVTALCSDALRLVSRGESGMFVVLAAVAFVFANVVVIAIALGSMNLIVRSIMRGKETVPRLNPSIKA